MHDVVVRKSLIFGKRLGFLMQSHHLSKNKLATDMGELYGIGYTHNDVRRWLQSGQIPEKPYKDPERILMPSYETIILIADYFGVDVGYLLGEIDNSTYEFNQAESFTGLSEESLRTIRNMTINESECFHAVQAYPFEVIPVLNTLLSSEELFPLVRAFIDIHEHYHEPDGKKKLYTQLVDEFGKELIDEAIAYVKSHHDDITDQPRDELVTAINRYSEYDGKCYEYDENRTFMNKVLHYELQRAFTIYVEHFFPST